MLNAINRAIDRFCYKHPRFGIRNLMLYIIGANLLVYLISIMDRTGLFLSYINFSPELIIKGQIWRLVTFAFIPIYRSAADLFWVAISMYFYYFIGSSLERFWGAGRFTIFYVTGILMNIIFGFVIHLFGHEYLALNLTAYYLNMSLFFAFAALYPDTRVLLFFIIPIKIKWLAYIDAAYFLLEILSKMSIFPLNLAPLIAIFNFLLFCGGNLITGIKRRVPYTSKNAQNFKSAAKKAQYDEAHRPFRHKCSVCGRTDRDHPELEFRYCSRCQGYRCFCQDHINNHIHFTE